MRRWIAWVVVASWAVMGAGRAAGEDASTPREAGEGEPHAGQAGPQGEPAGPPAGGSSEPAATQGEDSPLAIEDLRRRIGELEAEQADLRSRLFTEGGDGVAPAALAAPAASRAPAEKSVWSKVHAQLYGFIKLDAAWDAHRIDTGDFARWVESERGLGHDHQFNMTASQTRLGLKFTGPELASAETGGLVEMDFYGGGAANKPNPMLRKAYLTIAWPELDLKLLAGQDSDVISPLYPETVNYTIQWWAGNIGYRRPQVRVVKGYEPLDCLRLELALAAARGIGRTSQFDTSESGEDAGFPAAQGRFGASLPLFPDATWTAVGVSGHWGQEEFHVDALGQDEHFDSWSINFDVSIPIAEWLSLGAEGFYGQDLDAYLGGVGQGVTILAPGDPPVFSTASEIHSLGGWVAARIGPFDGLRFNLGASADNPRDSDLVAGNRSLNLAYWGNAFYRFYDSLEAGLEFGWWRTEYRERRNGDGPRVQMALIFYF